MDAMENKADIWEDMFHQGLVYLIVGRSSSRRQLTSFDCFSKIK